MPACTDLACADDGGSHRGGCRACTASAAVSVDLWWRHLAAMRHPLTIAGAQPGRDCGHQRRKARASHQGCCRGCAAVPRPAQPRARCWSARSGSPSRKSAEGAGNRWSSPAIEGLGRGKRASVARMPCPQQAPPAAQPQRAAPCKPPATHRLRSRRSAASLPWELSVTPPRAARVPRRNCTSAQVFDQGASKLLIFADECQVTAELYLPDFEPCFYDDEQGARSKD